MTIPQLHKMYREKKPISFLTAHDYISGVLADRAEVDAVLVGDSLAMVCLGYSVSEISSPKTLYNLNWSHHVPFFRMRSKKGSFPFKKH